MSNQIDHHPLLSAAINIANGFSGTNDDGSPFSISWGTPVTVIVHGVVIAGVVIGRDKYLADVVEGMKTARIADEDKIKRAAVNGFADAVSAMATKSEPSGAYLYLGDTKTLNVIGGVSITQAAWCIRVADVSAFMIGHPA